MIDARKNPKIRVGYPDVMPMDAEEKHRGMYRPVGGFVDILTPFEHGLQGGSIFVDITLANALAIFHGPVSYEKTAENLIAFLDGVYTGKQNG